MSDQHLKDLAEITASRLPKEKTISYLYLREKDQFRSITFTQKFSLEDRQTIANSIRIIASKLLG